MPSMTALQHLEQTLDQFEEALYSGEMTGLEALLQACQNFQATGQNFDDARRSAVDGGAPAASDPSSPAQERLAQLLERLIRVGQAVELTQESVRGELSAIQRGRRGLRGYQWLKPIRSEQYISITH